MKRLTCILISMAFMLLCLGLLGQNAIAKETVTLKLHNPVVEKRALSQTLNKFATRVAEKTNGTVIIKVYHGGSLGVKDADILRLLKNGFLDASVVYAGYLHRDAPEINAAYTDGAIAIPAEHAKAVPAILDTYKRALKKWDIVYAGFVQPPLYETCLFCKEPVDSLEKLKGKKVRVWSKQQVETMNKLGVSGQIIPQADMYMALQTGVVDCAIYLAEVAPLMHLQEVVPYESYLLPWAAIPSALGFSQKAWNKLSAKQQAAVTEAAMETGNEALKEVLAAATDKAKQKKAIELRISKGFKKLQDFPPKDRALIVMKAKEAWADLAKEAGPEAIKSRQNTIDAINQ